uniref:Uncharacterized protein n=1 Tax=Arundo donax TaxID=35708 RepID=A0A0A9ASN2_ARUDO
MNHVASIPGRMQRRNKHVRAMLHCGSIQNRM